MSARFSRLLASTMAGSLVVSPVMAKSGDELQDLVARAGRSKAR